MNEKSNPMPMMYKTIPAVAELNKVPGFDPLKFLRHKVSRKTNEEMLQLELPYQKLWFRLRHPQGRMKLTTLRITEQLAIMEARVYLDRSDAEPISSYISQHSAEEGTDYVQAAQDEALSAALSDAGFGLQFADVAVDSSIALDMDYAEDMIGVDVGSVIKLTIGDQEIPVTVSGLLINDGLKNGHGPLALDSTCMVATKELFQEAMPKINCFDYSWSIVSDPKKAEQIENSLSAIISSNPDLDLDTIGIHKDYEEMENRVVFGGFQALSWLVFLFGVVNLINTTLSNQMSRKRENSVFRAIGLTRKQLCQMTIYEGICYAFSAALATLAVGLPIAIIAARKFSEMTFHVAMPYSFPFLQMGLFVLVLFGLEVILSFWTMRRQKNQSLVEEMRAME